MLIVVLVGSLREKSYNRMLFNACTAQFPEISFSEIQVASFPLYNADMDTNAGPEIEASRQLLANADGFLVISPEYNRSIPGGLKNALDWLSTGDVSFVGIPALVMGATTGSLGTANAQSDIKKVLLHLGFFVLGQPEIYISKAASLFDEHGGLTDERVRENISKGIRTLQSATKIYNHEDRFI